MMSNWLFSLHCRLTFFVVHSCLDVAYICCIGNDLNFVCGDIKLASFAHINCTVLHAYFLCYFPCGSHAGR